MKIWLMRIPCRGKFEGLLHGILALVHGMHAVTISVASATSAQLGVGHWPFVGRTQGRPRQFAARYLNRSLSVIAKPCDDCIVVCTSLPSRDDLLTTMDS